MEKGSKSELNEIREYFRRRMPDGTYDVVAQTLSALPSGPDLLTAINLFKITKDAEIEVIEIRMRTEEDPKVPGYVDEHRRKKLGDAMARMNTTSRSVQDGWDKSTEGVQEAFRLLEQGFTTAYELGVPNLASWPGPKSEFLKDILACFVLEFNFKA